MLVQAIGVKQTIARGEFPFVACTKSDSNCATIGDALFTLKHGLDKCLGRVDIGIRKIPAQTMGGGGPKTAALVFANIADAGAGEAFFNAVLDPIALEMAKEAVVG